MVIPQSVMHCIIIPYKWATLIWSSRNTFIFTVLFDAHYNCPQRRRRSLWGDSAFPGSLRGCAAGRSWSPGHLIPSAVGSQCHRVAYRNTHAQNAAASHEIKMISPMARGPFITHQTISRMISSRGGFCPGLEPPLPQAQPEHSL